MISKDLVGQFFKAYDIRGRFPDLGPEIVYWVGRALVEIIFRSDSAEIKTINILYDIRLSSPTLCHALIRGIEEAGGEVLLLGMGSTDMLYAACQQNNNPGVMITASHNPKDDNGLKIVRQYPEMLGLSSGLDQVRDFVIQKLGSDPELPARLELQEPSSEIEKRLNRGERQRVIDFFLQKVEQLGNLAEVVPKLRQRQQKLKIVVDCGNAMGGMLMPWIRDLYQGEIDFVELFWELDGTFPNHQADPLNFQTLAKLQSIILEQKADLGIALDGDADRVYFVDERGEIMKGDETVAILASNLLRKFYHTNDQKNDPSTKQTNPAILFDQRSRSLTSKIILENAGAPIPTKVGHTNFKANMKAYQAIYGGEVSGHHYFRDFGCMDSGAIAIVSFIEILVSSPESLTKMHRRFSTQSFTTLGELNFQLKPNLNLASVTDLLLKACPEAVYNTLDGLTIYTDSWQANIRFSNTEPLLRINLETYHKDQVNQKIAELKAVLDLTNLTKGTN